MSSDRIGRNEPYLFPHRSPGAISPLSQELSGVVWTRCALSRRAPWTGRHLTLLQIQTCKYSKIVHYCHIHYFEVVGVNLPKNISKHISKTPLDAKIQYIIIEENIQYRQPNKRCRNTKSFRSVNKVVTSIPASKTGHLSGDRKVIGSTLSVSISV